MLKYKKFALSILGALLLLPATAHAQGKVFARVGDWQIKRFPKYCVASIGFEGDRGLRISSSAEQFTFGFYGTGTANVAPKTNVAYWFDNNKKNKFTRTAVKRASNGEDGGTPWLIFVDPASEPSHAADWELSKTVTFTYRADNANQTETFFLKGANKAVEKLFACSGQ